jgi:hypothetical protein
MKQMAKINWREISSKKLNRNKINLILVCIFLSSVSWLFIKLSRESAAIVPIEIIISNIPDNIIFTSQADSVIMVSMQSTGLKLLAARLFGNYDILEADFNSLQRKYQNDQMVFYLSRSQAEMRFAMLSELPRTAFRVQSDTIFFPAVEAFRKKVPVIPSYDLQFVSGFNIYRNPVVIPDSIDITGPFELRDSIEYIVTEMIAKQAVYQSINRQVKLVNPFEDQEIYLSQKTVEVQITVEEYTEATVELSLRMDCPENRSSTPVILLPDRVTVHYLVALRDDKAIDESMFKAFVPCPDSVATGTYRLRTEIREKPALVRIIRTRPAEIEFITIQ